MSVTSQFNRRVRQRGAAGTLLWVIVALVVGAGLGVLGARMLGSQPASQPTASTDTAKATTPALLNKLSNEGKLEIQKRFATVNPDLQGFLVKSGSNYQVVYGLNDYLLVGNLLSPEGKNMNAEYTQQYRPKIDVAKVVDDIEKQAKPVVMGPDKVPMIYAFADPNCIFCHRLYEAAEPLVKAGKLQVRWILVGFLKKSSAGRAAAILTAKDPAAAMEKNEDGFNSGKEEGAIEPMAKVPEKLDALLKRHMQFMNKAGGSGTPTVLYKDAQGNWAALYGAPKTSWLKDYAAGKLK